MAKKAITKVAKAALKQVALIKLPKGKLAVLNGLDGFIVAEKDNVLLICKKEDSSALVRKYVNEVQMKRGDDFI